MMIGQVSRSNPFSDGLRVEGRAKTGGRMTIEAEAAPASSTAPRQEGVAENFKKALAARAERYQDSNQTKNQSPEAAQALADSLGQAAVQVREIYGQEAANAFMARILKGVDEKGFKLESLADSVGAAVRDIGQTGRSHQLEQLTASFNQDLNGTGDGETAREVKSLSRAVGDFFGLETRSDKKGTVGAGFTKDGHWGEISVKGDDGAPRFIKGTPDAARQALESSASFSLEAMGEETRNDLADFLRLELGAEKAADYLENQSGQADFMNTMDTVISLALGEADDPGKAASLEQYLNSEIKTAVNAVTSVSRNPFGFAEFEGWTLERADGSSTGTDGAVDFSSKWRYTNRDDVTYTRTGQARAKPATEEEEPASSGTAGLNELLKKLGGKGSGGTGELVDETV